MLLLLAIIPISYGNIVHGKVITEIWGTQFVKKPHLLIHPQQFI